MADKNMEAQISVEFEEATSRQSLNSGETINTLWSKVKRWLSDLKAVAFSGSYIDLSDKPTTATTDTDGLMSAKDKSKLDNADNKYALKSKYGDTTINVGRKAGTDVGARSTAEGYGNTANGNYSHAEGEFTTASGGYSHAEGIHTTASGEMSHAEGNETTASGANSHAEGFETTASGLASHAGGTGTKALHDNEVAYGIYNLSNNDTLFSVGDGTSDSARHNAFEITTKGGKLHDKNIITSGQCIQFVPYNMLYFALNDRLLLFSNDDAVTRGIYFINDTPNDIVVCALISATGSGPIVQYGYGSNTYPEIQNTGEQREWFSAESITTYPTIYTMTVPSGKLGYYGVYQVSESAYATINDIRCPYFNYF